MKQFFPTALLGEVLSLDLNRIEVDPTVVYEMAGVLSFARGLFRREPVAGSNTSYRWFYRLKPDHVVMSQLFGWEGALALSSEEYAGLCVSPQFPTFLCNSERLDRRFLGYIMQRRSFWEDLGSRTKGMGDRRRTLTPEALLACVIPLPPLGEQRRIVARIEALAAKIEEARGLRRQAVQEVEVLTRSHLNRLFGDFYNRVAGRAKIERWEKLDAVVTDVADGPHVTPTYVSEGVPFITVLNITSGHVLFADHKFISPEDHAQFCQRAKAQRGDVLISKDGTIGIPCFVDTDREFSFFVSVALVKPNREVLDGEFLTWVIRAPYLQERIGGRSRGDMIRHLVLREIRDLTVPVPSLPEQRRIVAELDALQARMDALKRLQAETAAELDALLPSILDRAFKGDL
jgi:type I restriction enzyme S subunit